MFDDVIKIVDYFCKVSYFNVYPCPWPWSSTSRNLNVPLKKGKGKRLFNETLPAVLHDIRLKPTNVAENSINVDALALLSVLSDKINPQRQKKRKLLTHGRCLSPIIITCSNSGSLKGQSFLGGLSF